MMLYAFQTLQADNSKQEFEKCCAIAAPGFQRLKHITAFSYIDYRSLMMMIKYHPSMGETLGIYQKACDLLAYDKNVTEPEGKEIVYMLQYHLTLRLLRAKFIESDVDMPILDEMFKQFYAYTLKEAESNDSPMQYVLQIRQGIYEDKQDMIWDGMKRLHKAEEKKLTKVTRLEIGGYLAYMSKPLQTPLSHILIGHNIRKSRKASMMSVAELADALGTDSSSVAALERGFDAATLIKLRAIANICGVTVGDLVGENREKMSALDPYVLSIHALTNHITFEEKEFILDFIKSFVSQRYPQGEKS